MRTILAMLLYTAAAATMMFGMLGVATWLIAPDPTATTEARAAPVLPRTAESIERNNTPLPEFPKETSVMRPVSQPMMKEAPAALTLAPKFKVRALHAARAKKRTGRPAPNRRRRRKTVPHRCRRPRGRISRTSAYPEKWASVSRLPEALAGSHRVDG
jgi:hypothetical protein